jgi:release factor glutamine methyltransferase
MSEAAGGTPRTLLPVLSAAWPWLQKRGVPNARRDTEDLLAHALGCSRLDLYLDYDRPLTDPELQRFRGLLRRRGQREPLQYLLGSQPFRRLDLKVDARALIPRPETEELVGLVVERERGVPQGLQVLDVGTGSGCIALSLLDELPGSRVTTVDVSPAALALCDENARGAGLADRLQSLCLDFLQECPNGQWDLLVSNPPYVPPAFRAQAQPELAFEPPEALYTRDEAGLEFYQRIAALVPTLLVPGGRVYLEIGQDQGAAAQRLFSAVLAETTILPDLAGRDRFLLGRRP